MTAVNPNSSIQAVSPSIVEQPAQPASEKTTSRILKDYFNAPSFDWPAGLLDSRVAFITSEEYEQIRSLKDEPFSKICENHNFPIAAAVLTKDLMNQKFNDECGSLSDEDLLKKFPLDQLDEFNEYELISDERWTQLQSKNKDAVRQESGTLSEIIQKHGFDQVVENFPAGELIEKFNAEVNGKSDLEILADLDVRFFTTSTGRAVIGDRFKELFSQGEVKVEKNDGVRRFEMTSDRYSVKEEIKRPNGWSYYFKSGTFNN